MSAPLIELRGVDLGYRKKALLSGVDLVIPEGDLLGIVGPNGSGKTTLLRGMLRLLPPLRGEVTHPRPLRVGYVPQRHVVEEYFPVSAADVVAMGLYAEVGLARRLGPRHRARARAALASVALENMADEPYRTLSGGQKQRALIARALVGEPEILVLDEPTTGMDLQGESSILGLVRELHANRSLTVLLVTHQLNLVAQHATRLALLHEGRLLTGSVEEILDASTLRDVYDLDVRVADVDGQRLVLPPRRPS